LASAGFSVACLPNRFAQTRSGECFVLKPHLLRLCTGQRSE
jgi:hypothetical protein